MLNSDQDIFKTLSFPGYKKDDIEIKVIKENENSDYTLSVKVKEESQKRYEKELSDFIGTDDFEYIEKSFQNSLYLSKLPGNIIKDKIQASMNNGLLCITIPVTKNHITEIEIV